MKNNEVINKTNNQNNPNERLGIVPIIIIVIIGTGISALLCGLPDIIRDSKKSNSNTGAGHDEIEGCYYMTGNFDYINDNISICIEGETVTFNYFGFKYKLYPDWIGDTLYIEDNYQENMFRCTFDREDSENMRCSSYTSMVDTGTYVRKKQ